MEEGNDEWHPALERKRNYMANCTALLGSSVGGLSIDRRHATRNSAMCAHNMYIPRERAVDGRLVCWAERRAREYREEAILGQDRIDTYSTSCMVSTLPTKSQPRTGHGKYFTGTGAGRYGCNGLGQ